MGFRSSFNTLRLLLIHQNFPGQFRQLVPHLLSRGHELMAICSHERGLACAFKVGDTKSNSPPIPMNLGQELWFDSLQRAQAVVKICNILKERNWIQIVF